MWIDFSLRTYGVPVVITPQSINGLRARWGQTELLHIRFSFCISWRQHQLHAILMHRGWPGRWIFNHGRTDWLIFHASVLSRCVSSSLPSITSTSCNQKTSPEERRLNCGEACNVSHNNVKIFHLQLRRTASKGWRNRVVNTSLCQLTVAGRTEVSVHSWPSCLALQESWTPPLLTPTPVSIWTHHN